jgi:hypothetical protein
VTKMSRRSRLAAGWITVAFLFVVLAMLTGSAMATIATGVEIVSDRPAATLLLPYFEVNLKKPKAGTTLLSINDASATAALTHVVVWSDLSVPVFEFNVYLTGYNVYRLDLASLIGKGIAPQTASAGQDPHDTIRLLDYKPH